MLLLKKMINVEDNCQKIVSLWVDWWLGSWHNQFHHSTLVAIVLKFSPASLSVWFISVNQYGMAENLHALSGLRCLLLVLLHVNVSKRSETVRVVLCGMHWYIAVCEYRACLCQNTVEDVPLMCWGPHSDLLSLGECDYWSLCHPVCIPISPCILSAPCVKHRDGASHRRNCLRTMCRVMALHYQRFSFDNELCP